MTEPREDIADESKSRERFVAGKFRAEMMTACPKVSWGDREWIIAAFVSEIEAAERDTRERCAQQVHLEAVNWDYNDLTTGEAINLFAINCAEAIRKGGE